MADDFEDERPTMPIPVECPVCKGAGGDCWLCLGLGSIDARMKSRWVEAGSPRTKEEFHDV